MTPSFFFSYASVDRELDPNKNIWRFFDNLNTAVYQLGEAKGFFDQQGIDAGADWEVVLRDALRTSRVLVPMFSPRYFMSEYCRWEWATFYDPYQRALTSGQATASPILPVKWLTPTRPIEPPYQRFQFASHDFPPRVEDLSQFISSKKHQPAYNEFVRNFARTVVERIRGVPAADRVVGRMPGLAEVAVSAAPPVMETGAQYIRCLFVTGLREEIVLPREFTDCYGYDPARKDWRPCFPSRDRPVSDIVEEAASSEGRVVRYLTIGPNLLQEIRDAEQRNNIVVLVVDPWSLSIDEWRRFVQQFDQTLLRNCAVIVVWNKEDPQTQAGQPLFRPAIRAQFDRHIQLTSTFFRESVMTIEEFQQALVDAFHKVRAHLINDGRASVIREGMTEAQPLVSI